MLPKMACLIPKLRHKFAEFLNWSYLKRLRILSSSTCVGLRYGLIIFSLRSFSGKQRITYLCSCELVFTSQCLIASRIYLRHPPTRLNHHNQSVATLPFSVTPSSQTNITKYRNINLLPIDYAFRPRLRYRLTLRRLASRRKPWVFGVGAFHPHYRYSCQHSHF